MGVCYSEDVTNIVEVVLPARQFGRLGVAQDSQGDDKRSMEQKVSGGGVRQGLQFGAFCYLHGIPCNKLIVKSAL